MRLDALCEAQIDFTHAGGVEVGAQACEARDDFAGRVGFDGVENAGLWQGADEVEVIIFDQLDVDDQAG